MMIKFEKHSKKTAFIFGMLSVLAFAPYHFVLMAVMAFSVLMFLLLRSSSMKKSFAIANLIGRLSRVVKNDFLTIAFFYLFANSLKGVLCVSEAKKHANSVWE